MIIHDYMVYTWIFPVLAIFLQNRDSLKQSKNRHKATIQKPYTGPQAISLSS
jgi:hypothetical protein